MSCHRRGLEDTTVECLETRNVNADTGTNTSPGPASLRVKRKRKPRSVAIRAAERESTMGVALVMDVRMRLAM